jgi:hypothetical protein
MKSRIESTMSKVKVSITLSRELLGRIDRAAQRSGGSRSAVIESWLRRADRSRSAEILREQTIEYYDSLPEEDRAEDRDLARASARQSRRVRYDG